MRSGLHLDAWLVVGNDCKITYNVHEERGVDFRLGSDGESFEFAFNTESLRRFVDLGTQALIEMEALQANETDHRNVIVLAQR